MRATWLPAPLLFVIGGLSMYLGAAAAVWLFDLLPLGMAVALEFVGPVLVAAFGSRSVRDVAALLLMVSGVGLIADVRWADSTLGVLFALSAAVLVVSRYSR